MQDTEETSERLQTKGIVEEEATKRSRDRREGAGEERKQKFAQMQNNPVQLRTMATKRTLGAQPATECLLARQPRNRTRLAQIGDFDQGLRNSVSVHRRSDDLAYYTSYTFEYLRMMRRHLENAI